MDLELPLIALATLGILASSQSSSSSTANKSSNSGTIENGKYIPVKQNEFKSKLNKILQSLESKLKIDGLRDYFMTIGWIESRYYPSAIRYEPNKGYHPNLFHNNKWKNYKYLWEYTGGLFQLFPYNALNTMDGTAKNLAPTTIFNPKYTIAYALDFAYRLQKKHGAETWLDIRFGWASLNTLYNKPADTIIAIENRLLKSTTENNINSDFLYEYVDLSSYEKYQFSGIIKLINSI
jgi:hypothetical protein